MSKSHGALGFVPSTTCLGYIEALGGGVRRIRSSKLSSTVASRMPLGHCFCLNKHLSVSYGPFSAGHILFMLNNWATETKKVCSLLAGSRSVVSQALQEAGSH